MTAPFITSTPANTTQFDLPPIASAPQWVAQATPFSQLFSQAQAAAPPPPAAPAPPAPPSPPPPPATSVSKSTANGGHTSSPPADSTAASPPSPSANSGDSPPNEVAASPTTSTPSQASQSAGETDGNTPKGIQPKASPSGGKGSPPQKKAVAAQQQQGNQKSSVTVATTTAQLTQIQKVAKDNDTGKNAKDVANNQANKDDESGAQNSAPAPTTTDLGAQAVAGAVAVLPATEPTTKSDSKTTTGAAHAMVQSAANVVQQAAVSKLSNQPASNAAWPNPDPGPSTSPTANTSTTIEKAASNAKAADAYHVDTSQAAKSVNTAAASAVQTDVSAETAASVPLPAQTVTAVATASEAQVVSTITVDPTTTGTSATPSVIDNAPPSASGTPASDAPPNSAATPSPFAASLAQNAPPATPVGGGLSTVDRARFVQRVARAFQAASDDGGQMRLRLSPPELGSLQLQISVKQGALSATIQADNSTAQQVLLDSLPDLRARLAQQDIRIEQFDVQLAGQGSGGMPQPQGNPDFNQAPPRPTASTSATVSSTTNENSPAVTSSPLSATGALNVIV